MERRGKDRGMKAGRGVGDRGAAACGWSQVAVGRGCHGGRVRASDMLPMESVAGVEFVQGDFTEQAVFEQLLDLLGDQRADLVISDMAPNMSGVRDVDQPKSMYLCELALDMAVQVLRPGGDFVAKVFQGEGFDEFFQALRGNFQKVITRKPTASRPRSREVYLLGRGFKAS